MARRLTLEDVIARSRKVHAVRWDFSEAVYVNHSTPLTILCPIHDKSFKQSPSNHLGGKVGCPECKAEAKRARFQKPFAQFVKDARRRHGNKYEYDESTYAGARTLMTIFCQEHGSFQQRPDSHVNAGAGCPDCADEMRPERKRLADAEVNKRLADRSRGNVQLVSGTYTGINDTAKFSCRQHGEFGRNVNIALHSSHPCVECALAAGTFVKLTTDDARTILEKLYPTLTVEPFEYRNQRTLLTFKCSVHDSTFTQRWKDARRGTVTCKKCWREATNKKRTGAVKAAYESTRHVRYREWLASAIERHGDKYDYTQCETVFVNQRRKIPIVCPIHGLQPQTPIGHITKGCRKCAYDELLGRYTDTYFERYPNEKDRPAVLYYLRLTAQNGLRFYKVGITINSVKIRHAMARKAFQVTELATCETTLYDAFKREQELQASHGDKYRLEPGAPLGQLRRRRVGASECFSQSLPKSVLRKYFEVGI